MTESSGDLADRALEPYLAPGGLTRFALDLFRLGRERAVAEIALFWLVFFDSPPLPDDSEDLRNADLFRRFEDLDRGLRVVYIPDVDPSQDSDLYDELLVSTHVTGARAFALAARYGQNEDARECLKEVLRIGRRLELTALQGPLSETAMSAQAVYGLASIQAALIESSADQALHLVANGFSQLVNAIQATEVFDAKPWWVDGLYGRLGEVIPECQRVATWVQQILEGSGHPNWSQVAQDCSLLGWAWGELFPDDLYESVEGGDGEHRPFIWFLDLAKSKAEERVSPGELKALSDQQSAMVAETRVKKYFFGPLWSELPDRARDAIIQADQIWFSGGRTDAVLNELRIAAEHLLALVVPSELLDRDVSTRTRRQPLWDYADACAKFGESLLRDLDLGEDTSRKRQLFAQRLPNALKRLLPARNIAEHSQNDQVGEAEIRDLYCDFVGIGKPGLLPLIAGIRKAQGGRRGALPSADPRGSRREEA